MRVSTLRALVRAGRQQSTAALATSLDDHAQLLFTDEVASTEDELANAVQDSIRRDRSRVVDVEGRRQFILVISRHLRLMVVGAVHIAQNLVPIAQSCGYRVTLIDPRRAFASEQRFPGVDLSHAWPDKALKSLGLDSRTALITLTHDPKLDEPALIAALQSDAFYIGALGSRRTHQARCERLAEANVSPSQLERIHAPIGFDIGAESPAEIAVSIMAEMTAALRVGMTR